MIHYSGTLLALQALKDRFDEHAATLDRLLVTSRAILPSPRLVLRTEGQPLLVRTLCAFQGATATADNDEDLRLVSQPDDLHWIVSDLFQEDFTQKAVKDGCLFCVAFERKI